MKLRNKKTGEIAKLDSEHTASLADFGGKLLIEAGGKEFSYDTLAELNEDWEDYKPAEPLIKDEKIRKAVRAWAEANNLMRNKLQIVPLRPSDGAYNDSGIICNGSALMSITLMHGIGRGLRDSRKSYTITELCGEEEE